MANHIRQTVSIRDLSLDEHGVNNIKIIQYADDTALFLKTSFEIKEAISSLEQFGKIAGTKLNIGKCEGLWIGSSKNRQNTYVHVHYTTSNGQKNLLDIWEFTLAMIVKGVLI